MVQRAMLIVLSAAFLALAGNASAEQSVVKQAAEKSPATEQSQEQTIAEEHVFLTRGYRYETTETGEDADLGLFLCGIRCNAMSTDYLNITTPGGWRMIRVGKDKEKTVSLENMGLKGSCICVGDDYLVKINNIYMSK